MKLQILSAIVAISATGAAADALNCGQVQTIYQDAQCCSDNSVETCAKSLTQDQIADINGIDDALGAKQASITDASTIPQVINIKLGEKQDTITSLPAAKVAGLTALSTTVSGHTTDISSNAAGLTTLTTTVSGNSATSRVLTADFFYTGNHLRLGGDGMDTVISRRPFKADSGLHVRAGGATIEGGATVAGVNEASPVQYYADGGDTNCGNGDAVTSLAECKLAWEFLWHAGDIPNRGSGTLTDFPGSQAGPGDWNNDPDGCYFAKDASTRQNGILYHKWYYNDNQTPNLRGVVAAWTMVCKRASTSIAEYDSVGLAVDHAVSAKSFHAQSDRRIKKDITDADTSALLNKIRSIQMHNYGYIESPETTVGFVAQELESIDDSFTSETRRPIPDILKTMSGTFSMSTLTVDLDGTEVEVGETLSIQIAGAAQELPVLSVENGQASFAVDTTDIELAAAEVFVVGRVVDDFLVINKDRIMATAVGAVQELSNRLAALEALNGKFAALEVRLAALE